MNKNKTANGLLCSHLKGDNCTVCFTHSQMFQYNFNICAFCFITLKQNMHWFFNEWNCASKSTKQKANYNKSNKIIWGAEAGNLQKQTSLFLKQCFKMLMYLWKEAESILTVYHYPNVVKFGNAEPGWYKLRKMTRYTLQLSQPNRFVDRDTKFYVYIS